MAVLTTISSIIHFVSMTAILVIMLSVSSIVTVAQTSERYCDEIFSRYDTSDSLLITWVDAMPEIVGGIFALYRAIDEEDYKPTQRQVVVVKLVVDVQGYPVCLSIDYASDSAAMEPALRAVRSLRFLPATVRGRAVAFPMRLPITFLQEESSRGSGTRYRESQNTAATTCVGI